MNLPSANIKQLKRKYLLVAFGCILFPCCTTKQHTEYELFRDAIPATVQLDSSKNIALICYNPEGCPPCNSIVGNLQKHPAYRKTIGDNSFIVYPSISALQLADYDRMFKEYGQVEVNYINDKKLYDLLWKSDKDRLGHKPKWVGLNTTTKECFCFNLKEPLLPDSIFTYFR